MEKLPDHIKKKIPYETGDERFTVDYTNRFGRRRRGDASFEGATPSSTVVTRERGALV